MSRFQEESFARRRLIFLKEQVIFQCYTAVWREDVHLEDVKGEESLATIGKHYTSGRGCAGVPHSDYMGCLHQYTSRHLTYDSDVLNAFAGMTTILTKRINDSNHQLHQLYGLPTFLFDWALLWECLDPDRRRRSGWPSWAWCGWIGTISMRLNHFDTSRT